MTDTGLTPERVEALTHGEKDQVRRLGEASDILMRQGLPGPSGTCAGAAGSLQALRERVFAQDTTIVELQADVRRWQGAARMNAEALADAEAELERANEALRTLAAFARTAPGRLPGKVQEAVDSAPWESPDRALATGGDDG